MKRDLQPKLNRQDFEAHSKKVNSTQKCSVKGLFNDCSGNIVRAHTISKSGSLKKIAIDGHVMGTKANLTELYKNNGAVTLHRVGINTASTFTGFCGHHDKILFSPLEDRPVTLDDEQLFLLAYRAIAREVFAKEASTKTAGLMREADRGMPPLMQLMMQTFATEFSDGVDLSLQELASIKIQMEEMLTSRNYTGLHHFVIEFSSLPSVLVSSTTQPDFDFLGRKLQDLDNPNVEMSHIIFNSIAYEDKGCFVFSWIEEHDQVCRRFIESLENLGTYEMANALIRFCYSYSENTWASPGWWMNATDEIRQDISTRLQHGLLIPHSQATLQQNGLDLNACVIDTFSYR